MVLVRSPPLLLLGSCLQIFLPVKERMKQGERGNEEEKGAAGLGSALEIFLAEGKQTTGWPRGSPHGDTGSLGRAKSGARGGWEPARM